MKKTSKITKEMRINGVIKRHPKTTFVFMDYGLHCIGCPMALDESIEEAAKLHHINLKNLIRDLNKIAQKEK